MRRIYITDIIHNEVTAFCNTLFANITHPKFEKPLDNLTKLALNYHAGSPKRKYINTIIKNYNNLKSAKPSDFNNFISIFENIIQYSELPEGFSESIVKAMRYDRLRSTEYPNFIKKFTIKACVSCNAILTVVIDVDKSNPADIKRKNIFELDHFKPTSKYPYFCTSFYNLHPTCGNCNRSKNAEETFFNLYTESENDLDVFEFKLSEESVVNYWIYLDIKDVTLNFTSIENNIALIENHNRYFKVDKIYEEQMDLVEELLQKSMIYNKASRESLVSSFNSIFSDETTIRRLIIGNYTNEEDIHKRPMAKFTQDIARQLGLI